MFEIIQSAFNINVKKNVEEEQHYVFFSFQFFFAYFCYTLEAVAKFFYH